MNSLRYQLNLFFIALGFLSRIPIPRWIEFSQDNLNRASRYFPLVGWLIGLICALVYLAGSQIFSTEIAVLLSMIFGVFLTGCFHEDGLADTCDGLGGGWTVRQKLQIMKDSRIGTYGAIGLWSILTLKFASLTQLNNPFIAILIAHPLSRVMPTILTALLPYVTEESDSKVKPLAESIRMSDAVFAMLTGAAALLLVSKQAAAIVVLLIIIAILARLFLRKQIGGFTGDALGATQQVSEVGIYLVLLVIPTVSLAGAAG